MEPDYRWISVVAHFYRGLETGILDFEGWYEQNY